MRSRRRLAALAVGTLVIVAGCGGGDTGGGTEAPEVAAAVSETPVTAPAQADGNDECGSGQAFPDDPDFRELLCELLYAQTDVLRAGGDMDPSWVGRVGQVSLTYAEDRDAAFALGNELLEEMRAAAQD